MNGKVAVYEPPMLVEVGGFTALTQKTSKGSRIDNFMTPPWDLRK